MRRACAAIAVGGLCGVAAAQAPVTEAVRGTAGAVEVDYPAGRLVARAGQTPSSPVLVRVVATEGSFRQRIEFMGVNAGIYDLRDFVQRQDGQPASDLTGLPIRIVSHLPPAHGTDLFLIEDSGFNLRAHYRELMMGACVLWGAVPIVAFVRRAMRKKPEAPPVAPAAAPPTIADRLREILDRASSRPITVEEQGALELLLFQFYTVQVAGTVTADPVAAIQLLRDHPETREIVGAVEHWLHARRDGAGTPDAPAAAMLRSFRDQKLTAAAGGVA